MEINVIKNAHVISLSGGLCSFFAALRVKEEYGTDNLYLLFADTRMEDEDLYRFLKETVKHLGGKFIVLDQNKTPWDIFFDVRYLGNSRIDPCSQQLKRKPIREYIFNNFDPATSIIHFGFDIEEVGRFERCAKLWLPYKSSAPLQQRPYITRPMMLEKLKEVNIELPLLYKKGFLHNNCGGFCIKAGQKQFKLLYEEFPERFEYHRQEEEAIRKYLDKDVSILRKQIDGIRYNYTLTQLKDDIEAKKQIEEDDWGGCKNCFAPDELED